MKVLKEIENIGTVCYEENVWTGKKFLFVDGVVLNKTSKTQFEYVKDETVTTLSLDGNFFRGVSLLVNGKKYEIIQKTAWYEYIVAFIGFVFIII